MFLRTHGDQALYITTLQREESFLWLLSLSHYHVLMINFYRHIIYVEISTVTVKASVSMAGVLYANIMTDTILQQT